VGEQEIKVTFQPSGRSGYVLPGTSLIEAAGRMGVILQTPCGGQGTCGKCRVRLVGESEADERSMAADGGGLLSKEEIAQGIRLACQTRVDAPMVVDVPRESTFENHQQILVSDAGDSGEVNPVTRKVRFELVAPSREDVRSDLARMIDELGEDIEIAPDVVRHLSRFLRDNGWRGQAVFAGKELLCVEEPDAPEGAFGVAFDVGTTTVVGTLFDLADGSVCGVASEMNAQIAYGDDVISRILMVREESGALEILQQAIQGTINKILTSLVQKAGIRSGQIYEVVIAGNSTMQQIVSGFDPSALGEVPFVQVFDKAQTLRAGELGLRVADCATVYVFPQIGGFVGGDTVAGMLAARLDRWEKPVLLVDIGTNGEIVLAAGDRMLAASTAAGPAFEGARITQGMRAMSGAIEKVIITDDVHINVIGNAVPTGMCGSALIDTVAELLRVGIIDETGRIQSADDVSTDLPPTLANRLVSAGSEVRFVLTAQGEGAPASPVSLWQKDVRELQLAAGAIRAGVNIMLRAMDLSPSDLGVVLLAGAFGNFIRRSNAVRVGLLPSLPTDSIRFIGNAASLGAKLVLLSTDERAYAARLRHMVKHVDLSMDPDFQMEFAMSMLFPAE